MCGFLCVWLIDAYIYMHVGTCTLCTKKSLGKLGKTSLDKTLQTKCFMCNWLSHNSLLRYGYVCTCTHVDAFFITIFLALNLTSRFHFAVCLFMISYTCRSQMTSKCGKNKKVAHELQASVSLVFLIPHFDVFCDL